jgi:predicted nucleic acid-binding protein
LRAFFDSNILVYLFDSGAPDKQETARRLFERHAFDGSLLLSTQVLQEFYVTVTRKLSTPLEPDQAIRALEHFATFPLIQVTQRLILSAAQRSQREMLSFWDALIIEAALSGGATILCSEDMQDGQRIDGLTLHNPFK